MKTTGHTLFISDLHLVEERPDITHAFFHFLDTQTSNIDALYILGDLFEVWLGDDDHSSFHEAVKVRLATLTAGGLLVYFMHGNRDVLIGEDFLRETGCHLLNEPTVIDLYGCPTLIMHGDSLCVDDKVHSVFRWLSRCRWVQTLVLAIPLSYRRRCLTWLRKKSQRRVQCLDEKVMDVNPLAVRQVMNALSVTQMIHGHTHKPAVHPVTLVEGKKVGKRFVLGAWDDSLHALVYSSAGSYYVLSDSG